MGGSFRRYVMTREGSSSLVLSTFDDILKHLAPDFGTSSAMSGTIGDNAAAIECDLCRSLEYAKIDQCFGICLRDSPRITLLSSLLFHQF